MPNLDPWLNQTNDYENIARKTINIFENHLLSIKTERQKMTYPNSHPTCNERQQKIIEMIDLTMYKYKIVVNTQKMNQQVIIEILLKNLIKKREVAVNKKKKLY